MNQRSPVFTLAIVLGTLTSNAFGYGVSHTSNITGEPLGGGDGYSDIIWPGSGVIVISDDNPTDFIETVEGASYGDIIYVDDDLEIDLTGREDIYIPGGVTLASGRGRRAWDHEPASKGALIYSDDYLSPATEHNALFWADNYVRLTGLRFRGPGNSQNDDYKARGFRAYSYATIDNCEFFEWNWAAIDARGATSVFNNNIHHNFGSVGYGIALLGSNSSVSALGNIFNANRHSIAASGIPSLSYEATNNLVLWNNVPEGSNNNLIAPAFDMHAHCEPGSAVYGATNAGSITIIDNTFLVAGESAIRVRGAPETAEVTGNAFSLASDMTTNGLCTNEPICFARNLNSNNWEIPTPTCSYNCVYDNDCSKIDDDDPNEPRVEDNTEGCCRTTNSHCQYCWEVINATSTPNYAIDSSEYDLSGNSDDDPNPGVSRWLVSRGATDDWKLLNTSSYATSQVAFGDFAGDGITDVFRISGSQWQVSADGMGTWSNLNSLNLGGSLSSYAFADFDGDGKTDVFRKTTSDRWEVSWSGTTNWDDIGGSSAALSELRFYDIGGGNGTADGRADIFRRVSDKWNVSFSKANRAGMTSWQEVFDFSGTGAPPSGSGTSISNLRFGDFNGSGATDIFAIASNGDWYVSYGDSNCNILAADDCNVTSWTILNDPPDSSISLGDLAFGDFNGNGETDVLMIGDNNRFQVNWSGDSYWWWDDLGQAPPFSLSNMAIRDFNDDGIDDVFVSHQD